MKTSTKLIMFLMLSSSVWANDIYVTQSGNNLVLDITQSGTGNTIGTLAIPSSLAGADTNFTVVQNGNTNELTFELNGNNYTGNFDVTGNSNTIDFKCDSGNSTSGCENITANITLSGGSSTVNLNIGENDDSTGTQVNITPQPLKYTKILDSYAGQMLLMVLVGFMVVHLACHLIRMV